MQRFMRRIQILLFFNLLVKQTHSSVDQVRTDPVRHSTKKKGKRHTQSIPYFDYPANLLVLILKCFNFTETSRLRVFRSRSPSKQLWGAQTVQICGKFCFLAIFKAIIGVVIHNFGSSAVNNAYGVWHRVSFSMLNK